MSSSLNSTYLNVNGVNLDARSSYTENTETGDNGYPVIATRAWVNYHDSYGGGGISSLSSYVKGATSGTVSMSSGQWAGMYCNRVGFWTATGSQAQYAYESGKTSFEVLINSHDNNDFAGGGGIFIRTN